LLIRIPGVLTADQLRTANDELANAGSSWVDGRATAGHQGAQVKRNLQVDEASPLAARLGSIVLAALERNPLFISAALPAKVYPPMFNRYDGESAMRFGSHVDGAVRLIPGTGEKIRTDLSATLFLSPPESYDGGELVIEDTYGPHQVKLPAGDMVLYPGTSLHQVTPVTRGARIACFFWVQSMVREDAQRALLFDLDMSIVRLTRDAPEHPSLVSLTGTYHNLVRMWAEA